MKTFFLREIKALYIRLRSSDTPLLLLSRTSRLSPYTSLLSNRYFTNDDDDDDDDDTLNAGEYGGPRACIESQDTV